jgi:Kef-type K+ transport system membrane component KefB
MTYSSDDLAQLRRVPVEDVLLPVLVQLLVIIVTALVVSRLFRWLGQSGVIGEIAAGLLLGPSALGQIEWVQSIFQPALSHVAPEMAAPVFHWILTMFSQVGLILLLFQIGLEFDFHHLQGSGRAALTLSLSGIAVPFGAGVLVAPLLLAHPGVGTTPSHWNFALFLGTALSITAMPVLGRLLIEMKLHRTRLGTLAITSAAVNDALGWILLATIAALARSRGAEGSHAGSALWLLLETFAFTLGMIFVVRPIFLYWAQRVQKEGHLPTSAVGFVVASILACAILTNCIGISAIFGAFLLGAVLSGNEPLRTAISEKMRDFTVSFFLPIFFTYTGLRTRVQSLDSPEQWALCGVVILAAIVGKIVPCALAARFGGFTWRPALALGALMNTRGLMELIVINVGRDLGVIPDSVYAMLVLMALVTTVMTTPLVTRLLRGEACADDTGAAQGPEPTA